MSKKKKSKTSSIKKRQPSAIEQGLHKIYADQNGTIDMTKLDHKQRSRFWKKTLIGTVVLGIIVAVAWAGFFLYESKPNLSNDRVHFDIIAPFSVHSGETVEYAFKITNNELVALDNVTLNAKFPHGFIVHRMDPSGTQASGLFQETTNIYNFELPRINPGATYTARVQGQLIGEIGFLPTISARLKFSFINYSLSFEKNASFATEITDTQLALTTEYRPQATHDEPTAFIVRLTNTNDMAPLTNIRIGFDLPETFTEPVLRAHRDNVYDIITTETEDTQDSLQGNEVSQSTEEVDNETTSDNETVFIALSNEAQKIFDQEQTFTFTGIAPGDSVTFELSGKFLVEENSKEILTVRTYLADITGSFNLQTEEAFEVQIIKGELLTTLIVNGSEYDNSVNFGEELTYLLVIQNKSKAALGDIKVRLVIDSPFVLWNSLVDENDGILSRNQLLWTAEEVSELRLMLPEDEVEIPVRIRIVSADERPNRSTAFEVRSFFEATVNQIDGITVTKTTKSPTLITRLNSDTTINAEARYFLPDGTAVGTGPLPPQVNNTTSYQIVWHINNTLHELENITLSTTLPQGVNWGFQSETDAGTLSINDTTITWTINKMPLSVTSLEARFMVNITPKAADANTLMTLLNETVFTATDTFTQSTITRNAQPLTTNINNDSGLVQD